MWGAGAIFRYNERMYKSAKHGGLRSARNNRKIRLSPVEIRLYSSSNKDLFASD